MEISKSTPYVRYRENISSTLHKGTIHIESEYLDRERKTTIESIEGQTWQNMVNGENKEEDILPRLGMKIEGNEDIFDSVEQHMPIDTIIGDVEPVANEDGTYTYEISTMEGSYAKTLDGENNFSLTSDGLVGDMYIKYNAQGEEVNGNIVMNNQSSYTIENSNTGEIKSATLYGQTLINLFDFVEPVTVMSDRVRLFSSDNFKNNLLNGTYTIINTSNKKITLDINNKSDDVWEKTLTLLGGQKTSIVFDNAYIKMASFSFSDGWTSDNLEEIKRSIVVLNGEYTDIDIPYFEGMQSVKMPVLTTTGKNLFDGEWEIGGIGNNDGLETGGTSNVRSVNYINVKPNTAYVASSSQLQHANVVAWYAYDKNKNFISSSVVSRFFTTPSNCEFIRVRTFDSDSTNMSLDCVLQIEQGSIATSYEPYKSNILTVNEDVELRGIGDVKDTLDCLTGEYTQAVYEYTFTGDEDWGIAGGKNGGYSYFNCFAKQLPVNFDYGDGANVPINCNRLPILNYRDFDKRQKKVGINLTYSFRLNFSDCDSNNGATVEDLKAYLKANPTTVQYPISKSVKTVDLNIQDQDDKIIQSLHTHPSTTHINLSSDGLIPSAELSYTMYSNIGETTGEQITDGIGSKLIEGKIYGDTLQNMVKKESIVIEENMQDVTTQKVDTSGVIHYNTTFDSLMLKGKTIEAENLFDFTKFPSIYEYDGTYLINTTSSDTNDFNKLPSYTNTTIKGDTTYLFKVENASDVEITFRCQFLNYGTQYTQKIGARKTAIFKLNGGTNQYKITVKMYPTDGVTVGVKARMLVLEYQDGMENWSLPFSSTSVTNPTVKVNYDNDLYNILSVNEETVLRSNGDVYDELDCLNGILTQRIADDGSILSQEINRTVTINITDKNTNNQEKLIIDENSNILLSSSTSTIPNAYYKIVADVFNIDMVKTDTQYTVKSSKDCNAIIDGVTYPLSANGTFTTPSTITDKLMVLDAQVDDLMFIEGDLTGRELDYFTGMQSVDMPVLYTVGKNLLNDSTSVSGWVDDVGSVYVRGKLGSYSDYLSDYIYTGGMQYIKSNFTVWVWKFNKNKKFMSLYSDGTVNIDVSDCDYIRIGRSCSSEVALSLVGTIQLEQGTQSTPYEPHQSSILTSQQPIALHRIGDVKDELDLVNECVVRRIGKIVLDGSQDMDADAQGIYIQVDDMKKIEDYRTIITCDKLPVFYHQWDLPNIENGITGYREEENEYPGQNWLYIKINNSIDVDEVRQMLIQNPITVLYVLETPTTEPVCIVPQNPKQSTVSLTLQSPLQKVGNVSDQLRWNPYKGHYVRYNYIQDGVANSTYTFEDLKDMNERKFVNLYNQRTYIDTDHTVQVISHGLSRYCLAEQGKQYQVRWDWVEQPSVDTIKVDLCGNVKEIPSIDNSVVIDVEKFTHQFIQIQGLGLTGKITNLMVIETVNGEIPDVDFFSGIQCIGNTVNIDGNTKVQIDMEQTNGNLIDKVPIIYNNGNNLQMYIDMVRPNKTYTLKHGKNLIITKKMKYNQKQFTDGGGAYGFVLSSNGSANIHYPIELCYADMTKDGIRPRYYDKESIILPMKLCRVGNIYDNLYYDDLKGYYRIQQSIGHKYFTGETTEVWTMETTDGYRTIKFTCTSANIDQIAYGGTICNSFKHLSTINEDMEGFIIYNGNFVIRVDKDRLIDKTVDGFKALLTSSPIHLFYQLKTPQMINLTEYPNRIELNTYRDEIFTFFKGMNPTKFTLSVPMDKTYRYAIAEEGQGLANRVTVNNETISAENMVAIKEVRGQGIANIIEDVNNVVITPKPNHEGRTTSHTLNNTKPATIRVHGFEPSGETAIGTYNTTDKAYQLKVMSSNGDNSLSDYYVLNVPYKLETYADGTKDVVYYDEAYNQWMFKGSSVKEYTVASDGTLNKTIEVFRGLAPRSGLLVEFKLMFTSGTTSARMYYSLDGITYSYTSLKRMTDGNYLYVGIFNTGGTKIDIAYKTDPNEEYTNLSPLSAQVPECFMVNQITYCTSCEVTLDKQYIYSEMNSPIELDTYEGSTKVFMDGNATDTNIIIRNEGTSKIVNTYTDTTYTVYWKYVDGLGNLRITLGGTTVEVDGKQEYATLKTQLNAPQELLYVGGYNLSIKDLMVVKGAKIDDLPYFEGSRQVGTLVLDEEGNKSYKITLVQGGSVLEQRDENAIAFKDDNKHNVVVHKIVGVCPTKVD